MSIESISADYLKRMGYDVDRLQWVAVRHRDKEHHHVHLVVSRVRLDGSLVHQPWEYLRNQTVCREIECDPQYNLRTIVQTREPGVRAPTRGEDRMLRDRGVLSEKEKLKGLIQEAARGRPSMTEFIHRLESRGGRDEESRRQPSRASMGRSCTRSQRVALVKRFSKIPAPGSLQRPAAQ